MTETDITTTESAPKYRVNQSINLFNRIASYTIFRIVKIAIMVVISVYLTILIANLGGFLDTVKKANIAEALGGMVQGGWMKEIEDEAERTQIFEQTRLAMEEAAGLNTPFLIRCFLWLKDGLTLNWGEDNRTAILEAMPMTLLVLGSANLLFFFSCITLALGLVSKYGSRLDKIIVALTPLGAAPSWVYGLIIFTFMILIFYIGPSVYDNWPDKFDFAFLPFYLSHFLPPIISIFISKMFQNTYAWRTIFLINSSEDYVEMARAKGVPVKTIERRYILRPMLPNVITSFALMIVSLWQEVIILETVFQVPGIGRLFRFAISGHDVRMIVALVVTFAYLLALIVFILDFTYALVDPRVKIEGIQQTSQPIKYPKEDYYKWRHYKARLPLPVRSDRQVPHTARDWKILDHWNGLSRISRLSMDTQSSPEQQLSCELLKDIISNQPGRVGRSLYDYLIESGNRLVEIGALVIPSEVLWLTRHELITIIQQIELGKTVLPLNAIINPRRAIWNTGRISKIKETKIIHEIQSLPSTASSKLTKQKLSEKYKKYWDQFRTIIQTLQRYPSALIGFIIIMILGIIALYTIIAIPYNQAIKTWRGDDFPWQLNPKYALPEWVNWFRKDDLPSNIVLNSDDPNANYTTTVVSGDTRQVTFSFKFNYPYQDFPQDLIIYFSTNYINRKPLIALTWLTPDGRKLDLGTFSINSVYSYYIFQDDRLRTRLKTRLINWGLFADPENTTPTVLTGSYELQVTSFAFEPDTNLSAKFVLYGKVWGIAGTDGQRRDVMMALLWGTVVALSFGLLAAVGTTCLTLVIAAIGTWFGGWLDEIIQRLTEINMIIPFFPVILLIYILYSKSIWVLLGITVLLSIFGSSIKNYRSLFLQIKEMAYIEAARAYGASDWRIIFRYLIPRIISILIPQMVILIPSYIYLEAALSVLGLYDPASPPTWGQLILDGLKTGTIFQGAYHMALEPAFFLMLTGYGFLLLGTSLERLIEPRLRNI